jgi:hypothetical protein
LDDGRYVLTISEHDGASVDFGELECRCPISAETPKGLRCIGTFFADGHGAWSARIATRFDPATYSDSVEVVAGASRLDAIAAAWQARHRACN